VVSGGKYYLSVVLPQLPFRNKHQCRFGTHAFRAIPHSGDLVYFTDDPSISAIDPCVTGSEQPMVSDGSFMMFKPLSRGEHVIRVSGEDVCGAQRRTRT
jgi:hypothetical protein